MKNTNNTLLIAALCLCISVSGCNNGSSSGSTATPTPPVTFNASGVEEQVEQMVAEVIASNPSLVNAAVLISIPDEDFLYQQGFGTADPDTGAAMTADHPYRLASISKTFTAAVVLRMVEEGHFQLDDNLGLLLQNDDVPAPYAVNDLLVLNGTPRGSEITVRQLLSHRSGLMDYIFDEQPNTETSYLDDVLVDVLTNNGNGLAQKLWTPTELLSFYLNTWRTQPASTPGQGYHYSDTNFLLLGLLIEKYADMTLGQAYRSYIFDPLQIAEAYIGWYEEAPVSEPAHHYLDTTAYGLDSGNLDVTDLQGSSVDWAGGGLVMNLESQRKFLRALVDNTLFTQSETFTLMRTWVSVDESDSVDGAQLIEAHGYGLGLDRETIGNYDTWGHDGFWGTQMVYVPTKNAIVVVTANQAAADTEAFIASIFEVLDEANW